jgi:hypothetical protein
MNTRFYIDYNLFEQALADPYGGCHFPENAAFGRATEEQITALCGFATGYYTREWSSAHLPEVHRKELGKDRCHDGLLLDDTDLGTWQFLGVVEAKLDVSGKAKLSASEMRVLNYCREKGLIYVLAVAKLVNREKGECQYRGCVDLTKHMELVSKAGSIALSTFYHHHCK